MSYQAQWALTFDDAFVSRCRACITQQSDSFVADARGDIAALAESLLRSDNPAAWLTFHAMLGAAPGLADKAENSDGSVNSAAITDEEILSNVQAEFPAVAGLYFNADGSAKP